MKRITNNIDTINVREVDPDKTIIMYHHDHYGMLMRLHHYNSSGDTGLRTYSMMCMDSVGRIPWDIPDIRFSDIRFSHDVINHYLDQGAQIYQFENLAESVNWLDNRLNGQY